MLCVCLIVSQPTLVVTGGGGATVSNAGHTDPGPAPNSEVKLLHSSNITIKKQTTTNSFSKNLHRGPHSNIKCGLI